MQSLTSTQDPCDYLIGWDRVCISFDILLLFPVVSYVRCCRTFNMEVGSWTTKHAQLQPRIHSSSTSLARALCTHCCARASSNLDINGDNGVIFMKVLGVAIISHFQVEDSMRVPASLGFFIASTWIFQQFKISAFALKGSKRRRFLPVWKKLAFFKENCLLCHKNAWRQTTMKQRSGKVAFRWSGKVASWSGKVACSQFFFWGRFWQKIAITQKRTCGKVACWPKKAHLPKKAEKMNSHEDAGIREAQWHFCHLRHPQCVVQLPGTLQWKTRRSHHGCWDSLVGPLRIIARPVSRCQPFSDQKFLPRSIPYHTIISTRSISYISWWLP